MGRWPLRNALTAYRAAMREAATEQYRHELLLWKVTLPYLKEGSDRRPPEMPEILRRMQ